MDNTKAQVRHKREGTTDLGIQIITKKPGRPKAKYLLSKVSGTTCKLDERNQESGKY